MNNYRIVLITVPSRDEAYRIADGLIDEHLVACVNILPGVESIYRWQGKIHRDSELMLVCKTEASKWDALRLWVTRNHSYDVPEIIQLPIIEGAQPYLDWITDCLKK